MPTLDTVAVIKFLAKISLYFIVIGGMSILLNVLFSLIPPLNLTGCAGYFFNLFGLKAAMDLYISIVSYGFTTKFTLSFFSRYLD